MIKKLCVMFDYDDVLFPLITPWVNKLNLLHNINVLPCDIKEWDITKFFPTLTKKQVFEPLFEDNFWEMLEPSEEGVDTLYKIKKDGHKIKIVTSTFYQNVKIKMERLFQCYPYITWNDVTITTCKQDIRGDLLVDDRPDNLVGGDYYKVLMNASHNISFDTKVNKVTRINKLSDVHKIITKIENC